jgi:hypothetical protein
MNHPPLRRPGPRTAAVLTVAMTLQVGLSGCGGGDLPKVGVPTYPVSGKVLRADGSPLPGGLVTFVPGDAKAPKATGPIAQDGTFSLNTEGIAPGAPAGEFKVRIELDPEAGVSAFGPKRGPLFPAKYTKETTSGLTATVQADGTNEFTFSLK